MNHLVGGGGASQLVSMTLTVCVRALLALHHTLLAITLSSVAAQSRHHSPVEELVCGGCPGQLQTSSGLLEKHNHSHMQGPKLITSTIDGVRRKVYPSHFLHW